MVMGSFLSTGEGCSMDGRHLPVVEPAVRPSGQLEFEKKGGK